jgi:hypothetical protein
MELLPIYEIGKDQHPLEGAFIKFFDSRSSFGMFEQNYTKEGKVVYHHNHETIDNALFINGCEIITDPERMFDENGDLLDTVIVIGVEDQDFTLVDGVRWCYDDHYYECVNPEIFPYQDIDYFRLAIKQKWISGSQTKQEIFGSGENKHIKITYEVRWNEKNYNIEWIISDKFIRFFGYEEI